MFVRAKILLMKLIKLVLIILLISGVSVCSVTSIDHREARACFEQASRRPKRIFLFCMHGQAFVAMLGVVVIVADVVVVTHLPISFVLLVAYYFSALIINGDLDQTTDRCGMATTNANWELTRS